MLEFSEPTTAAEVEIQEKDYHFEERFEQLFQEKEIYLNPDLKIVDLATALGTNRTYVSNYHAANGKYYKTLNLSFFPQRKQKQGDKAVERKGKI